MQRGYAERYLDSLMAAAPSRQELLQKLFQPKETQSKHIKPVITLCLPSHAPGIKSIFSLPSEITAHPLYKQVYGTNNIVLGRKNEKSIGAFLTHKRIKPATAEVVVARAKKASKKTPSYHEEIPSAKRSRSPFVGGTRSTNGIGMPLVPLLTQNTQNKKPRNDT